MSPSNKKTARLLEGAPKIITATVALMEELTRVLIQEIDIVIKRRVDEHPAILKYKQKLANDYRANLKALADQPQLFATLSEDARTVLRDTAKALSRAAADNARALRAAIGASQQLIQNIMAMIKTKVLDKQPYKNAAKSHLQLGIYSPVCPPVAVSRSV
ncbi:MAG: hypothetical protein KGI37_08290 [Alphaproteobacteria bacterium]|nr:hypothetical protein [Alphaproteobacteria bacterium]